MTEPIINEYQLYCITEGAPVTSFDTAPPTACKNNTAHEINPNSIRFVKEIRSNVFTVKDTSPDGGYFQVKTEFIDVPAPTSVPQVYTKDVSYPFDMHIWEMSLSQHSSNIGDVLDMQIAPNSQVGVVIQNVNPGDTIIYCYHTVFTYVHRGCEIGLSNGVDTEFTGMVIAVDPIAQTLTLDTPIVNTYPVGSVILWSVYPVRNMICDSSERMLIGTKGLKSRIIKANTPMRIIYTDNTMNASPTRVYIQLQYYRY